jgi:hypothetical protein
MDTLREYMIGEFQGTYPEIPTDPKIDIAALTEGDDDPFFVTLPVAQIGRVSENGLVYDEKLVNAIEAQMVGKGGNMGHIKPEDRSSAFPVEDVDWVASLRVGDTTWGKAYVPPGKARTFIRRLKARGGQLATSIYGPHGGRETLPGGSWRAANFTLESLDLAPADRAALKISGQFAVTAQMTTDNNSEDETMDKAQLIAELKVDDLPEALRQQVIQGWQADKGEADRVAELENQLKAAGDKVAEMEKQVAETQRAAFEATLDNLIAETVKIADLRPVVRRAVLAELAGEAEADKAKEVLKEYTEGEEYKGLAQAMSMKLQGGAAIVGELSGRDGKKDWKDRIADNAGELAQEAGA